LFQPSLLLLFLTVVFTSVAAICLRSFSLCLFHLHHAAIVSKNATVHLYSLTCEDLVSVMRNVLAAYKLTIRHAQRQAAWFQTGLTCDTSHLSRILLNPQLQEHADCHSSPKILATSLACHHSYSGPNPTTAMCISPDQFSCHAEFF
jgi:hypothetical protein